MRNTDNPYVEVTVEHLCPIVHFTLYGCAED